MSQARLAIDVGTARIGVARCDVDQIMALPVATLAAGQESLAQVAAAAATHDTDIIYVGLPVSLSGASTRSTAAAVAFARDLAPLVPGCQVRLVDERLTTRTAQRHLADSGRSTRASKAVVDQAAAMVILEHALETEKRTGAPAGIAVGEYQ